MDQVDQIVDGFGFVERNTDLRVADGAEIDLMRAGVTENLVALFRIAGFDVQGIEPDRVQHLEAGFLQFESQGGGESVGALGDFAEAFRSVVHTVRGGHHGKQNLRRADVGGRFFTADVLLAGLQRHAVGWFSLGVDRHADDAARKAAFEAVFGGEESRMRTSEAHRNAEALRGAHHDIGTHLTWRFQHDAGQQIRCDHRKDAVLAGGGQQGREVAHVAGLIGVLHEQGEQRRIGDVDGRGVARHEFNAEGRGAGVEQGQGLGKDRVGHKKSMRVLLRIRAAGVKHRHGFGRGGGFIQQRCIGDFHAGEVHHHGLEIDEHLQSPLRDFSLIRRVRRVPTRIFQDVAEDHLRRDGVVITHADEAAEDLVLRCEAFEFAQEEGFVGGGWKVQILREADGGRDRLGDEIVEGCGSHRLQHGAGLAAVRADVSGCESLTT